MKAIYAVSLVVALSCVAGKAEAGPYGDDMSKCLVSSTSTADKSLLMKWIFSAMSLNKDVSAYVNIPAATRDQLNKDTGALFTRLLAESCKQQTRDAYKYEGSAAISSAFEVLGKIATQGIFGDPAVAAGIADLMKNMDQVKVKAALGQK
jgi:hypothetical protein